jgi:hypothetical protein
MWYLSCVPGEPKHKYLPMFDHFTAVRYAALNRRLSAYPGATAVWLPEPVYPEDAANPFQLPAGSYRRNRD